MALGAERSVSTRLTGQLDRRRSWKAQSAPDAELVRPLVNKALPGVAGHHNDHYAALQQRPPERPASLCGRRHLCLHKPRPSISPTLRRSITTQHMDLSQAPAV